MIMIIFNENVGIWIAAAWSKHEQKIRRRASSKRHEKNFRSLTRKMWSFPRFSADNESMNEKSHVALNQHRHSYMLGIEQQRSYENGRVGGGEG